MVNLTVNGQQRSFDGDPSMPLMWYLRDELGLTGTKFGCGVALCGACTVHLNGEAVRSCGVAMSDLAGKAKPAPTDKDIMDAMSGNLCRCGCYQRIEAAVRAAAKGA